ncbi:hypothetical protein N7510_006453 [Penicillium lagena]|uniref:uncharacterized protein n=1 Tax=Penicillium lagena TaxID=94218 RepID=UPI002540E35F|nr:uncharacterized protein N7510_006453 [Penicillium lagena]KAJ5613259.1 hypothetical protein N7510_006453 [Penicillium lagena]
MDGLLTAVNTVKRDAETPLVTSSESAQQQKPFPTSDLYSNHDDLSPDQIISVLRSNPDREHLSVILAALDPFNKFSKAKDVDIRIPSPTTAQILQVLVSATIPDHWRSFDAKERKTKDSKTRAALLRCLSSVAGLGSIVAQVRSLVAAARGSIKEGQGSASQHVIQDILTVLAVLLEPKDFLSRLYADISVVYDHKTRQQVAWRELASLVAAGRILSTAAEALTLVDDSKPLSSISWTGNGSQYALWLGDNVCHLVSKLKREDENAWGFAAFLLGRALSLGYTGNSLQTTSHLIFNTDPLPDQLVRKIYLGLLIEPCIPDHFGMLLDHLRQSEQLAVVEAIFRDVQKKHFSEELAGTITQPFAPDEIVKGVAALCATIIGNRPFLKSQILEWLSKSQGGSIQTLGLRRALLATLANQEGEYDHYSSQSVTNVRQDALKSLLERGLEQFGDKFHIKHLPIITQNANAQLVLLAAGHLRRLSPAQLKDIGRTGIFLNSVSNRLASSSNRARFLGMIVGTGMSRLIEEPGKAMEFDLEEMRGEEAHRYLSLITVQDEVGSLESIRSIQDLRQLPQPKVKATLSKRTPQAKSRPQTGKIVAIEEIDDSDEGTDEDEDLIPYEKPDADASDSDEDPTLVQRNKPTAPVYIRDLITCLRDIENVERYHLAIATAPSLIRRKTGFGTELIEQTEELALILVGLQNDSNAPQFHESRLQSMIALIVSQPLKMGRWFTAIYFDGDLSQVQRSAVLTALGLSAREIAGNGDDDARMLGLPAKGDTSFPSKRLTPAQEAIYSSTPTESPIATLTREMSRSSLQPLAADAADVITGPNALKVRTFSSRMEVEKKRQERDAQRQKSIIKDLHKVLAEGFFYPLQGRFEVMMLQFSSSSASSYNPFFIPHLLTLFLQTLSLTLTTAGPHTPFLAGLTHETLSLLLSLHSTNVSSEPTVTAALLSLFLAVIDLNVASGSNGEERLVTEYATQVIELREWASQVFDRMPPVSKSDAKDDPQEQVRTLAAGIMVRTGEVMERYQGRLMGVNAGFRY